MSSGSRARARVVAPAARLLAACLLTAIGFTSSPVRADPPPWAPAHGWRGHHERGDWHEHGDWHERERFDGWERRRGVAPAYVVPLGRARDRCGRSQGALGGAILGGAGGAVLGGQMGRGPNQPAAIAGGAILGAVVGAVIGQAMDEQDAACVGRALSGIPAGRPFLWDDGPQQYQVIPLADYSDGGSFCRTFEILAGAPGRQFIREMGAACLGGDGIWRRAPWPQQRWHHHHRPWHRHWEDDD